MGWFGLFDLVRLGEAAQGAGESIWRPGRSDVALADADLAALHHASALAAGHDFVPDLFDIASHHIACAQGASGFHVDLRLAGRAFRMAEGGHGRHGLMSWFAEDRSCRLRLCHDPASAVLREVDPATLLAAALGAGGGLITSVSLWVADAPGIQRAMGLLAPWLAPGASAIARLPAAALADALDRMPTWPCRCAAVLPAAWSQTEATADVILCLDLAGPSAGATSPPRGPEGEQRRSGVAALLSSGAANPARPAMAWIGDAAATPIGAALLAWPAAAAEADCGFLLEVSAARIVGLGPHRLIVPLQGPPMRDPGFAAVEMPITEAEIPRPGLRAIAARATFLMGGPQTRLAHLTQMLPTLEHVFRLADREGPAPGEIDVAIPADAAPFVGESLVLAGIDAARIVTCVPDMLFARLLVAGRASDDAQPARAAIYDAFWARGAMQAGLARFTSFSRRPPAPRLLLHDPAASPLANAADLVAIARARGYDVVDPASTGLGVLATALAAASIVVGPAGVLGWACLADRASLGMLIADCETTLPHAALHAAAARGHTVTVLTGTGFGGAADGGFAVAPEHFSTLLERLDARRGARS